MKNGICVLLSLAIVATLNSPVSAQGLRVSTVVYDASRLDAAGNEPVLSRSFTLFQSGRAYDYVEAANEVVLYEPVARRFVVMDTVRQVYTRVPFAEVQSMLAARQPKTEAYISELLSRPDENAERTVRMLRFQQKPEFEIVYSRPSGTLLLKSPSWKYAVSTREWNDEEQVQRYLTYTDWTAQLNYILHPASMFPEPRLALNAELRKHKNRFPVVVQLDLRPDQRLVLRAEHQFTANLTDHDRELISQWDKAIQQSTFREVPLRKYQTATLISGR